VTVTDTSTSVGGAAALAAALPGRDRFSGLLAWWHAECERAGVTFRCGDTVDVAGLRAVRAAGTAVLLATGGRPGPRNYAVAPGAVVRRDDEVLAAVVAGPDRVAQVLPDGPVVVLDLVGGPIAVGIAEALAAGGRQVAVVTADQVVGTLLALSGDLADGNTRLLRAGVVRRTGMLLREVRPGTVLLEDRFGGEQVEVDCAVLVHCGHRVPEESLYLARSGAVRAGDCVAPRSVLEATLEARRAADALEAEPRTVDPDPAGLVAGPGLTASARPAVTA
jgi:hypothetical protein